MYKQRATRIYWSYYTAMLKVSIIFIVFQFPSNTINIMVRVIRQPLLVTYFVTGVITLLG